MHNTLLMRAQALDFRTVITQVHSLNATCKSKPKVYLVTLNENPPM